MQKPDLLKAYFGQIESFTIFCLCPNILHFQNSNFQLLKKRNNQKMSGDNTNFKPK